MGDYSLYLPFVLAIAGIIAALVVWAFPGTDNWIGFAFAIAGVVLALAGIVWGLWRASS
jgi:hypothetical protein